MNIRAVGSTDNFEIMANSYHQIYIQAVFAVKYRKAVLDRAWRPQLFRVIGNLVNETGCKIMIVGGIEDHLHCFFGLHPAIAISQVLKSVKAKSSKFINENRLTSGRFEWQRGYGVFSYNQSQVDNVWKYIKNQESHHRQRTFREEYLNLLKEFQVEYDEQYIFHEPL